MKIDNLENFVRGWIIGKFSPSLLEEDFEVGIMKHKSGEICAAHYHKESDEINVIISGHGIFRFISDVEKDVFVYPNDIVIVHKNEIVKFIALEDIIIVVIKTKSVKGDKYLHDR